MCAINLEDSFSFGAGKKVGGERGALFGIEIEIVDTLLMRSSLWPGATPDPYEINGKQQLV